jgi:predicted GIY-YIG superfamily endonuclease
MPSAQRFVYIINSRKDPSRYYTGLTSNVKSRLADYNNGHCRHTAKARPWSVVVVIAFADARRALEFDRYLKSGSSVNQIVDVLFSVTAGRSGCYPARETFHSTKDVGAGAGLDSGELPWGFLWLTGDNLSSVTRKMPSREHARP